MAEGCSDAVFGDQPFDDVEHGWSAGVVEALTCGTGSTTCATSAKTLASYGYTAYGANDTTLASGLDVSPSAGAFPFNTYRFRAGRLDPTTGNLDLGVGAYNPNINGFISQAGIAGDPRSALGGGGSFDLSKFLHDFDWSRLVNDFAAGDIGEDIGAVVGAVACNALLDPETGPAGFAACGLIFASAGAGLGYQTAECAQGGSCSPQSFAASAGISVATAGVTAGLGGLLRPGASRLATEAVEGTADAAAADAASARVGGVCGVGAGLSFAASTPVATPSGERAIGSLKVGDQVTAYDPGTGKSSTQTVQHVWINHDHDLLDVTLHEDGHATQADSSDKTQQVDAKAHGSQAPPSQDETIHTTEQHPWLTTDRGWVKAGDLLVGEHVVELGGRTATITALAVHPGAGTYYNLTVSKLHTYAVGDGQAVVHNTGPGMCKLNDPSSEISQVSMWARIEKKIAAGRNVAVFRLRSGEYLAAANDADLHSEEILDRYIANPANGLSREDVTGIYSERDFCVSQRHMCARIVGPENYPNAQGDISFSLNPDIGNTGAANRIAISNARVDAIDAGRPAGLPGYQWIP